MVLMEASVHQRKSLVLTLLKEKLTETKSLSLKPIMGASTFRFRFVYEAYLMDLVVLSIETYL